MENFRETIKNIRQDLLATVECGSTILDGCWYIKGTWYDSKAKEHETTIYTRDRTLATGWQDDPDNLDLRQTYQENWAQTLIGYIIYKYDI